MTDGAKFQDGFFATLFERAVDGYIVMDKNLVILYLNETAREWFGEIDTAERIPCRDLISCRTEQGDRVGCEQGTGCGTCLGCQALSGRASTTEEYMTVLRRNGLMIPVSVSFSHIPFEPAGPYVLMAFRDISRQKKLEQERIVNDALQFAAEERERIARDLHDTVAQDLAYAGMQIKRVRKGLLSGATENSKQIADELKVINEVVDHGLEELRNSLYDLNFVLETDFIQFLRENATKLDLRFGISTNILIDDSGTKWPEKAEVQLARVTKEVISNIRKHAKAKHVRISVVRTSEDMTMVIEDDGCGFDPNERTDLDHYGMRSIVERCRLLGGYATVHSSLGKGTRWRFYIPSP